MDANESWESAMENLRKIVQKIITKKDSDIFREPVPYEELGLTDYIDIVKEPMDLGTVMKKLDGKKYSSQDEVAKDIRRIWLNALLYNMPGSKIYTTAKALSESFEANYLAMARDDPNRPPNAEEMTAWVADCHQVTSEELGQVLQKLEAACPQSLIKRPELNEVEVNVDLVPGSVFREIRSSLENTLPWDNAQRRKVARIKR
jgi:hypothetical protein